MPRTREKETEPRMSAYDGVVPGMHELPSCVKAQLAPRYGAVATNDASCVEALPQRPSSQSRSGCKAWAT